MRLAYLKLPLPLSLVLWIAAASCGGSTASAPALNYEPSPGATSVAAPPRSADLTGLDAVEAGVRRLSLLTSYRAQVIVDTTGGDKIEGSFEFVAPDRYHLTVSGGVPLEVVTIGATSYVKTGGRWQAAEPTFLPFSPQDLISQIETIAQNQALEAGSGDGGCTRYRVSRDQAEDAQFCVEKDGPLRSATFKDGATTVKVDFADFDAKIEIKQPI